MSNANQRQPPTANARLLATAARIVPRVPPQVGYPLCDLIGLLSGPYTPAWSPVLANLRVTMPGASDQKRIAAARRVIAGMFKNYYDLLRFHTLHPAQLDQTFTLSGAHHAHRAIAAGRGTIVVAPHCGNYTVIFAAVVRHFNVRVLLVVEQIRDPQVHELMNRVRQMPGIEVAPLDRSVGRRIIQALRNNDAVILAADRAIAENTVTVDFFGRPTALPSGPATIALRTDATVLPGVTYRLPDNRSIIHIEPPLEFTRSATRQNDVRDATQKIAYSMQAQICRAPWQWLVAESIWPAEDARHIRTNGTGAGKT